MKVDNLPDVDENSIIQQIDVIQKKINQTKKKLTKVFDDYEEGIYTANEFVERKTKHNATIEILQKQMRELENSIPEKEEYEELIIMLSEALDSLLDEELDAEVKNEYLKRIIDKIEYSRENNEEFILDVYLKN
jgi:DNA repair ATPase RecN